MQSIQQFRWLLDGPYHMLLMAVVFCKLHHDGQNKSSKNSSLTQPARLKTNRSHYFWTSTMTISIPPCIDFLWLFLFLGGEINPDKLLSPSQYSASCKVFQVWFLCLPSVVKFRYQSAIRKIRHFHHLQNTSWIGKNFPSKKACILHYQDGVFKFYGIRLLRRKHKNGKERGAESIQKHKPT